MTYTNDTAPAQVREVLGRHILTDGFDMVVDLKGSHGVYLRDALHNREMLDFFASFATIPVGYNHPKMREDQAFLDDLLEAALANPANSDLYTTQYAHFVETFERVGIPDYAPRSFFIAGGGLAVENAFKAAMDWKVQKNFAKGYRREVGLKVMHFRQAFHGRTGYTLSVTNTAPDKTKWFAKFEDWPRILNPAVHFPLTEEHLQDVQEREALALRQMELALHEHKDDICAVIIEPIQSEGGDNHFRPEFMVQLRQLCDAHEMLLIYDEVQTGVGASGKFWAHQNFGPDAQPDMIAFGKKMQICGVLAGPRLDEVPTNVFRVPSRINSTWGGNLVDMVRAARILEIIEEEKLIENAAQVGAYLLEHTQKLAEDFPHLVSNPRGMGLLVAFDLVDGTTRDAFIKRGLEHKVIFLGCGPRTIRFRPPLVLQKEHVDAAMEVARTILKGLHIQPK